MEVRSFFMTFLCTVRETLVKSGTLCYNEGQIAKAKEKSYESGSSNPEKGRGKTFKVRRNVDF